MSDVVKLELVEVGEGFRFDPDALLEAAKGQGFATPAWWSESAALALAPMEVQTA